MPDPTPAVERLSRPLLPWLVVTALLGIWQLLAMASVAPEAFLPSPTRVVASAIQLLVSGSFLLDLEASMLRVLVAFLASAGIALPLAWLAGTSRAFERAVMPVVGFFRYTPVAAFVPLCILWVGIGDAEKIAVIFIGTFFQIVVMLTDAVRAVPSAYYQVSRTLGGDRWQVIRDITLPASASATYDALRVGFGWAWSYVVLAELVAASTGVGYRLVEAQRYMRTTQVFAGIFLVGMVGLLLDFAFGYIKPLFFPWQRSSR